MTYSIISMYNGKLYSEHSTYEAAEEALTILRDTMSEIDYNTYELCIAPERIDD